jgi:hypothetical protein
MILKFYKQTDSLPLACRYLTLNGIKSLSVARYSFAENSRKPWRIWENTNPILGDSGWPQGEFRTKREAMAIARELAEWVGLPIVSSV